MKCAVRRRVLTGFHGVRGRRQPVTRAVIRASNRLIAGSVVAACASPDPMISSRSAANAIAGSAMAHHGNLTSTLPVAGWVVGVCVQAGMSASAGLRC